MFTLGTGVHFALLECKLFFFFTFSIVNSIEALLNCNASKMTTVACVIIRRELTEAGSVII